LGVTKKKRGIQFLTVMTVASVLISVAWRGTLLNQSAATQETLSVKRTPPAEGLEDFMKAKLLAIDAAMESASTDNFTGVARAGIDLIQLSKQAAWNQHENATYLQDTADFVDATQFMIRMAHAQDRQGVASSFGAVSACCLDCHRHVRSPKVAVRFPDLSAKIAAIEAPSQFSNLSEAR